MKASCSDDEFIRLFKSLGPTEAAKTLGVTPRSLYKRRRKLEERYGFLIDEPSAKIRTKSPPEINLEIQNGVVIIGSDAHIWPGPPPPAIKAFIRFCRDLKPKIVVLNGDVLDFPSISRHPVIGWAQPPKVQEEIEAAQAILHEIEMASGRGSHKIWTLGNHCIRMDSKLANSVNQFVDVKGVCLADHFPNWEQCWSVFLNRNVMIKHRYRGGIHAPSNNTLWAGCTIVTGHLHSQKICPIDDYRGTRYGVDTGCLADTKHEAFEYSENNPKNWRSGFCVLTFKNGELLPPELVTVWGKDSVVFRGEVIKP